MKNADRTARGWPNLPVPRWMPRTSLVAGRYRARSNQALMMVTLCHVTFVSQLYTMVFVCVYVHMFMDTNDVYNTYVC